VSALILTLAASALLAGSLWLVIGSRLTLSQDVEKNEVLNLGTYFLCVLPVCFVLVFFGIGA
jgi:hypothetical protein